MLSRLLSFPLYPLHQGPVESDSARTWAIICTAATVPAFIRVQDNGWFPLAFIRNKHIYRAYLNAHIASITNVRVKDYRPAWSRGIRSHIDFFFFHNHLFSSPVNANSVPVMGFIVFF
jgi:hypothetical protein